ncbi:MAG: LysM repeat protein [Myxococcota bacterium]|jgi:LysM repeat protein
MSAPEVSRSAHRSRRAERSVEVAAEVAPAEVEQPVAMLHQRLGNAVVQLSLQGMQGVGPVVRDALASEAAGVIGGSQGPLLRQGNGSPAEIIRRLPSGGQPLPEQVRARFESAFGHDFSHVRIHTGGQAGQASHDLSAHAFALGADLYFGGGECAPGTPAGDRLLAHELTHVKQADEGRLPTPSSDDSGVSSPSDPAEQEAYGNENRILSKLEPLGASPADASVGEGTSSAPMHGVASAAPGHGSEAVAHRDPKNGKDKAPAVDDEKKGDEDEKKKEEECATYVVKEGDWLSKIAQRYTGDPQRWPELYALNKEVVGDDPNLIFPGTSLKIPPDWPVDAPGGDEGQEEETPGQEEGSGEEEEEESDGPGEEPPTSGGPELPGPGEDEEQEPEPPSVEPPSGGGRPPPVEPTPPSEDELEDILDDICTDDRTRELEEQANPLVAGYGAVADYIRENAVLNALMGAGEGLIPIYGLYDGVRDAVNTGYGQIMTMVDNGVYDPVLMGIVGLETVIGAVGNIFAHLSWLADLAAIAAAALGVSGGAVVGGGVGTAAGPVGTAAGGGVGTAVGGAAGLTVGALIEGIGMVCGAISTACDFANTILGALGAAYSLLQSATGGIFTDLTPEQEATYDYMAFAQAGFAVDSAISGVMGIIGLVTFNLLPKALTKGVLDEGIEAGLTIIGGAYGGATNRGGTARSAGTMLVGELLELGGVDTDAIRSVAHEGTVLPQDILGDMALAGAVVGAPFLDRADWQEIGRITGMDLIEWLAESPPAADCPQVDAASLGSPDHSFGQVARLQAMEGAIGGALTRSGDTPAAVNSSRSAFTDVLGQVGEAQALVDGQAAESEARGSTLETTIAGITGMLAHADTVLSRLGELDGVYEQISGALQGAMGLGDAQIDTGVGDGGGLIGQVVGAVVDAAANAVMGQLTSALSGLGGMVGGGIEQLTGAGESATGGQTALSGFVDQVRTFGDDMRTGVTQYASTGAGLRTNAASLAQAQADGEGQLGLFDQAQSTHDGETAQLESLLSEVRAERERQAAANARWLEEHGPQLSGDEDEASA